MREIKFRVYDTVNKCFISDMSNFWINPSFTAMMEWRPEFDGQMTFDLNDSLIFQQYTGLKDKNGVEIYEGDILEFIDPNNLVRKATVEYAAPKFKAMTEPKDCVLRSMPIYNIMGMDPSDATYPWKKIEVIENIFEGVDK